MAFESQAILIRSGRAGPHCTALQTVAYPDVMPQDAKFHLGLTVCQITVLGASDLQWFNFIYEILSLTLNSCIFVHILCMRTT